jgi:hypothetical protein
MRSAHNSETAALCAKLKVMSKLTAVHLTAENVLCVA